jgi:hypothetical protein
MDLVTYWYDAIGEPGGNALGAPVYGGSPGLVNIPAS